MPLKIAVLGGTGAEGFGLALRFARAGAEVAIGSRDAAKAAAAAARLLELEPGARVAGRLNQEACRDAGTVILTVPVQAQRATLASVRQELAPGAILVDATVPLEIAIGGRLTHPLALHAGSAAEQAARYVPGGVRVVAAFHSLSAHLLADTGRPVDSDVLLCGDDAEAKAEVAKLVEMLPGARAVDAGALENARLLESVATLMIALNLKYKVKD